MHTAGTVSVKDTGHTNVDAILSLKTICQCFGDTLSFIIASPGTNRIDMTPILFGLGMNLRVTINLYNLGLINLTTLEDITTSYQMYL